MTRTTRMLSLLAFPLLAACEPSITGTSALQPSAPAAASVRGPVVASVTGLHETDFGAPAQFKVSRKFSIGAVLHEDGTASGNFHVNLRNVVFAGERRGVTFDVNCLVVNGNEAWVGGTIKAPKTDQFVGAYDIWHVVDGGENGPDRVDGFLGVNAPTSELRESLCGAFASAGGAPAGVGVAFHTGFAASQQGEIHVRDDQ